MKLTSEARDTIEAIIKNDGVDCVYNGNTVKVFFLRDTEKNTDAYTGGVSTATAFAYGTLTDFAGVQVGDVLTIEGNSYKVMEKEVADLYVVMYVARI